MKNKKKIILFIFLVLIFILLIIIYNIWKNINNKELLYVEIHWNSMNPTLSNWEKYSIKKIESVNELGRNDIVLFDINWSDIKYIKRLKILPWDKYTLDYENDWSVLIVKIKWWDNLRFRNYRWSKFYKTLLLWSNNTKYWWVKAPQCWVFWDNIKNSVDTLEYWFIWCNKITHKLIK